MASRSRREADEEYELVEYPDSIETSLGKRLALFGRESEGPAHSREGRKRERSLGFYRSFSDECFGNFVIEPNGTFYQWWTWFILVWATYSSFFTPFEFGFFRGLPNHLWALDVTAQVIFVGDVVMQFFLAFRDAHTYKMVYDRRSIALRYAKASFVPDLLGCLPWDILYKAAGRKEELRFMLWIRLYRVRKLHEFLQKLEKDIRINYLFTRIVKLLSVELYCTHTAACIFYYLATTLPESKEGFTWIGSLTLGDYNYNHFREINVMRRYITSLYFAIVTMATVGYGDIRAVNSREMIFVMIFVSFDMILGAYLIGNMTALIVKGSKTERFRDTMTDLIKYMNRNKLGKDIRTQIKDHVRLQYESSYSEASALQNIPISIRAKVSQSLYMSEVEKVPLFKGCSSEFISQIVTRLHEEFFLPGEIIMEQGYAVDQLYIVSNGSLEELTVLEDGLEDTVARLEAHDIFGEIAVLCNIPQPYTVRVCELCRLLRLEKQSFVNILQLYFKDGRQILTNLLEGKDTDLRIKQLESDITLLIAKQEAELALQINSAAYHGDLYRLKNLIRASEGPTQMDYDGRTALHLAASKGYEEITMHLIQAGADVNHIDRFGNTPLLEAVKAGHDRIASLLTRNGASLVLEDAGGFLCKVVANGNTELLKRLLANGVDPNSNDYNRQTPLHMAAAEGLHLLAKILLESGASVFATDRWDNTPLDEGRKCGSKPLIQMLEEAQAIQTIKGCANLNPSTNTHEGQVSSLNSIPCGEWVRNSGLPEGTHSRLHGRNGSQYGDKKNKTCTVFPFHPWSPREKRRHGLVMWVPHTIEALLHSAVEHFGFHGTCILTEDAGKVLHVDLIQDSQRLYVVNEDEVPES